MGSSGTNLYPLPHLLSQGAARSTKPFALQADHNVVLVADIGGTNCRFVLWRLDLQTGNHEKLFSKVSRSL